MSRYIELAHRDGLVMKPVDGVDDHVAARPLKPAVLHGALRHALAVKAPVKHA